MDALLPPGGCQIMQGGQPSRRAFERKMPDAAQRAVSGLATLHIGNGQSKTDAVRSVAKAMADTAEGIPAGGAGRSYSRRTYREGFERLSLVRCHRNSAEQSAAACRRLQNAMLPRALARGRAGRAAAGP